MARGRARSCSLAASVASALLSGRARLSLRREAVSRGRASPRDDAADWEAWVRSRMAPAAAQRFQLLQEYYAHDAWQLLGRVPMFVRRGRRHDCISRC